MAPPPLPISTERLLLLTDAARLLQLDRPLALRLHDFFLLLHSGVTYRDSRLTCWFQSAQPGTLRQQFYSPDGWLQPWDDAMTRQVALAGRIEHRIVPSTALPKGVDSRLPVLPIAYLGAPIFWGGRLWGVLELRTDLSDPFDPLVQEFVASLLPHLAAAIAEEGQRQYLGDPRGSPNTQYLMRQRRDQLLTALEGELEGLHSLQKLLTLLLRWALDATGAEAGAVSLVDYTRGELALQVYEGYAPDFFSGDLIGERYRWSWSIGLAGQAVRSGRALLVRDVGADPNLRAAPGIQAELAAPIMLDGQALAVLVLDSPRSDAFGEAELEFITNLSKRVAWSLRRALDYQTPLDTSTHLGQVFTSLPTGLALMNTDGLVLRYNPAWLALWGLPQVRPGQPFHVPRDLEAALLTRLADPRQLGEFYAEGIRAAKEEHETIIRLSNPTQELRLLTVPIRDASGEVTARLWAVNDVTREREVDRLKNEFVAVVSHELRTPLTSILGYTELLLTRSFSPNDQREFVQTVYNQATGLAQLVDDLLGISRLDAGQVKLNRWMIELQHLLRELTSQLPTTIDSHRVLFRVKEPIPPVYVDRDKIRQILINLLMNAIKYSPQGGEVELVVQAAGGGDAPPLPTAHPAGRWVMVSVCDQGIGIAPEDLPRIWERFFRVDNSNTRRIGGTGLGLSITQALVELHGGRIWAESVLGQGSVFTFTLPIATELERRL